MRTLLLFVIFIAAISLKAQTLLPASFTNAAQKRIAADSGYSIQSTLHKKWFFTTYSGVAIGYNFFNGGNATVISAPVGLQLNHSLTNNLYAFTGVSVAPAYINFNRAFLSPGVSKFYPNGGSMSNGFGLYSRVDVGLMYVNDARTFSISGSVGVERSSNPLFLYQQTNSARTSAQPPGQW